MRGLASPSRRSCCWPLPCPALAQIDARLMRQPAVSATQIAFVYAGDIWVAPKAGGVAQRLSARPRARSRSRASRRTAR